MTSTKASTTKAPSLRAVQLRLKQTQAMFNDICLFVSKFKETTTANQVQVRLEKVDELWEQFSDNLIEIQSHEDFVGDEDSYTKEMQTFSSKYYEAKAFLMDKLSKLQEVDSNDQSGGGNDGSTHTISDHVRLPQIQLQTFKGDIDDWLSFRDLFISLIHSRTDLPDVEKLHYLKGCLQGEPKGLIDALQITNANYKVAWDLIQKRYDNSKQLKKRQIQSLFKLPHLSKESVTDLHCLLEGFGRIVQTLDQVVQQADYKDLLLINILSERLDPVTRRSWEEHSCTKEQDTLKDMMDFLRRRLGVLEALPSKASEQKSSQLPVPKQKPHTVKASFSSSKSSVGKCVACSENHYLFACPVFLKQSVKERDGFIRKHSLCRNCLRVGHQGKDCLSKFSCRTCKGRHHTLVCFKSETSSSSSSGGNNSNSNSKEDKSATTSTGDTVANLAAAGGSVCNTTQEVSSRVLLATAVVLIEDGFGNSVPARALLDSGSECNFVSERLCQLLKVVRRKVDIKVQGIGQASTHVKHQIEATVRSRSTDFLQVLNFLVLSKVTVNLPTATIDTTSWSVPQGIILADPGFFNSNGVDMVLGIESFFNLFNTGRKMSLGDNRPTLVESVFGWVVCGTLNLPQPSEQVHCNLVVSDTLEELLTKFWSFEEVEAESKYSPEEASCETQFQRTVRRADTGRYIVSLPKDDKAIQELGESRDIAMRRFISTERRLAKDDNLRKQYVAFMDEYQQLEHMREVHEGSDNCIKRYYLPHHPVVKEDSTTTKVRVVFDASCKTSTGVSLNDALYAGPVIQDDLRAIIIRGRTKQIMIVADVEKMFRQIWHGLDDLRFLNILWRASAEHEIKTFELCTVTYGTKSAPFLATRTLKQLTVDEGHRFPSAAVALAQDTYMDDVITGVDEVSEAIKLRSELQQMMASGGFHLRKWASNCPEVLRGVQPQDLAIQLAEGIDLEQHPSVTTLGLIWIPGKDKLKFKFKVPVLDSGDQLTKRKILSTIATLFDPTGLVGATITAAKIFMQRLWTLQDQNGSKLSWDQPVPQTVGEEWYQFYSKLPLLREIEVDRCVIISSAINVEIHTFSDASEKAYGACLYIRSQNSEGDTWVRLLESRSKVAPLKTQSIPRLELCGALLAAQLCKKVKESIRIEAKTYFWTDSTCVLRWIDAVPNIWTTFVANRVSKIQGLSEGAKWSHVPGSHNPADLISRGISPENIVDNRLWWTGPDWLLEGEEHWPSKPITVEDTGDDERRRSTTVATAALPLEESIEWYISKFSSYMDLIRRTAYWLRVMDLLRRPMEDRKNADFLSTEDLRRSEAVLIRRVQQEAFPEEWQALSKGSPVGARSSLKWFNPFICKRDGLMKIGGRLHHSLESEEVKHPIILPARHLLTRMLIRHYHEKLLHANPQLLLSTLRLRYWPLGGRSLTRQIVHKCLKCYRTRPSTVEQFMGELPSPRVTVSRPFSRTGVDYFGPVYVRPGPRRAAVKAYVSVFICLCTKAIHMELVTDLSTERFLQALRRFMARRGKPSDMFSDNGTNFVGANNQMIELRRLLNDEQHREKLTKECTTEGIRWHFTPPSGPHFGGIWEAAVRSCKIHLLKVLGENVLSFEDMNTLIVQIEACLNSRPLMPMTDDPDDLEPLTPGHFLIGTSLQSPPEENVSEIPMNRLKQWQVVQQKVQQFWKRWRREYLCQLQGRMKRWKPPVNIEVGRLVIVKDDKQPPLRWKMARIHELHPGSDDIVRVVTLKTSNGFLKRPVEKICILPICDEVTPVQEEN